MDVAIREGSSRRRGMIHLNNNLLCAVDCETTGDRPGFHDLYQICVLPLDADVRPMKDVEPFYCDVQLKRPDNVDEEVYRKNRMKICRAQIAGVEPYFAADLFDEWFRRLDLPYNKQIVPLAQNWPHDRAFIIDWMGEESLKQYFSPLYRDTMVASLFINDHSDHHNEPVPFAHNSLKWLTRTFHVPHERPHDALQDCLVTAEVYRQMCKVFSWQTQKSSSETSSPESAGTSGAAPSSPCLPESVTCSDSTGPTTSSPGTPPPGTTTCSGTPG